MVKKATPTKVQDKPNPVGRPPLFDNANAMVTLIKAYFVECDKKKTPYTVPGLAYALGFEDRHAISVYAKKPEFSATIKKAKLRIEQQRAEQLITSGNAAGKIFDLKNNFDWEDRNTTEHEVKTIERRIVDPND